MLSSHRLVAASESRLRLLAPAAVLTLALSLSGCAGGSDDAPATAPTGSPSASSPAAAPSTTAGPASSPTTTAGTTSAAASPSGSTPSPTAAGTSPAAGSGTDDWHRAAIEAAVREALGAGARIETQTPDQLRAELAANPSQDAVGPISPDDSAECTAARKATTSALSDAIRGGVAGAAATSPSSSAEHTIVVVALRDGDRLLRQYDQARQTCGLPEDGASAAPSATPEPGLTTPVEEVQKVRVGTGEGTATSVLMRRYEGQTTASGAPDAISAVRGVSVYSPEAFVMEYVSTPESPEDPGPLADWVAERTPTVEAILEAARG